MDYSTEPPIDAIDGGKCSNRPKNELLRLAVRRQVCVRHLPHKFESRPQLAGKSGLIIPEYIQATALQRAVNRKGDDDDMAAAHRVRDRSTYFRRSFGSVRKWNTARSCQTSQGGSSAIWQISPTTQWTCAARATCGARHPLVRQRH